MLAQATNDLGDAAPLLAALLSLPTGERYPPLDLTPQKQKERTLRALVAQIEGLAARTPVLPDLPSVAEFVGGYEASGWNGLGAPRNTPPDIIDTLNRAINAALADPQMKAKLAALGSATDPGSPADFGKLIAADTEKWAKVVKATGIQPE